MRNGVLVFPERLKSLEYAHKVKSLLPKDLSQMEKSIVHFIV